MRAAWRRLRAAGAAAFHLGVGIGWMAPGCAGRGAAIADSGTASDGPAALDAVPDRSVSELDLTWRGRPAGRAREELWARGGASGFRFARRERWRVMRGGALVEWETEVVIDADRELRGEKVTLYRDRVLAGSARRSRSGWVIEASASGGARLAPARAEPAELVLVRLALSGASSWAGPVLLAGFDFAVAELAVEPDGSARRTVLSGPAGVQETRVWLGRGGTTERAVGPDLSATRTRARPGEGGRGEDGRGGTPPDLVELGAIRVRGGPAWRTTRGEDEVALDIELAAEAAGGHRPAPRVGLPGQRIRSGPSGWRVELGVSSATADQGLWPPLVIPDPPPGPPLIALADRIAAGAGDDPLAQLRALATATATALEDDLSRGPVSDAAEAAAAGRGDCVAHAALFSALARARGFDLRLVTGYRLEGRALTRHLWAVVRLGRSLVAVDPTFGEAPAAPGRLLGLAVHGSAPGEIALAAELAFAGLTGAGARFAAW